MSSRQYEWQKKRMKEGKCRLCGEKRYKYAQHCDKHQEQYRIYSRDRLGFKPKVDGGVGRPIFEEE